MSRLTRGIVGCLLACLAITPLFAQIEPAAVAAPPTPGPMTPAMQQEMMMHMQDMMVMMQNTAVWTPQGLVVLQGNRVLHYSTDLRLQNTVVLPLPPAAPPAPDGVTMPTLRSQVPAKLVPTDDGVLVIRGQQIIRLDRNFKIAGQTMMPDLPPLTTAETNAVCPMCQHMMMMMGHMPMGGTPPTPPAMPMP